VSEGEDRDLRADRAVRDDVGKPPHEEPPRPRLVGPRRPRTWVPGNQVQRSFDLSADDGDPGRGESG
jgi:hypothetical protein